MNSRDRAIRLARAVLRLPTEGRVLVLDALAGVSIVPEMTDLNPERDDSIRAFRKRYCGELSGNGSARRIDDALQIFEDGEWPHCKHLISPPANFDERRARLFTIMKFGKRPGFEALRKILRRG